MPALPIIGGGDNTVISQYLSKRTPSSKTDALSMLCIFMATLVLCCMLTAIPGYFSSDEMLFLPPVSLMKASARFAVSDMTTFFHPGTLFHSLIHAQFFRPTGVAVLMGVMRHEELPFIPHLVMVVLHGMNCALLYCLFRNESRRLALVAALLFAVSPLAMYAVGWVAAIFDLLVTMFALLTVLSVRSFVRTGRSTRLLAVFIFTVLALCSKETAVVMPAVAVLGLWPAGYRTSPGRAWVATGTIVFTWLAFMLFRSSALLDAAAGSSGGYKAGFGPNVIDNLRVYVGYPFAPGIFDVGNIVFLSVAALACSIVALALVFFLTAVAAGWRRSLSLIVIFLLPLLPVLILTKHETQYLYASSIGLSLALASCLVHGGRVVRLGAVILGALLVIHAAREQDYMYQSGACQTRLISDLDTYAHFSATSDGPPAQPVILPAGDAPWWVLANVAFHWDFWNKSAIPGITDSASKANLIMTKSCHLVPNSPSG